MRTFLSIFLFFAFVSFSQAQEVTVSINDQINIQWDNDAFEIIENENWNKIVDYYKSNRLDFIDLILKKDSSNVELCNINRHLTLGEVVFLAVRKIENIPFFEVYQVQLDLFDGECPFPLGMFDYVDNNRFQVIAKTKKYVVESND